MKKRINKILGVALSVMLLVSLIVTASPVMATISEPDVSVVPDSISTAAVYTIEFDTYFPLIVTDTITVEFPSGTTVPDTFTAASITISNDANATTPTYTAAIAATLSSSTRICAVTIPAAEVTTGAAHMGIKFLATSGVISPGTPGTYTLKVKTSQETTYVTSDTYTVGVPGMVTRYNDDGNYVGSYNTVALAIAGCNDEDELRLGPGTYAEDVTVTSTLDDITIVATGDPADTIIKGNFVFDGTGNSITGITFKGTVVVNAAGTTGSFTDCAFTKVSSTSGATLFTNNANDLTVDGCTFDTTSGSVQDTAAVLALGNDAEFKGCTFTTDEGTTTAQDTAISVTGAQTGLVVKTSTFTGTKGVGYSDASAAITTATVKDNTFDGFEEAISYSNATAGATLTIRNNTISNQTKSTVGAIDIDAAASVVLAGNTISDSTGYSVHVLTNGDVVAVMANNFLDNAKGLKNANAALDVVAENNWWGNTAGPTTATTTAGDKVSSDVDYKPFITQATSAATYTAAGTALDGETTCGVAVEAVDSASIIMVAGYTSNPKDTSPTYSALVDAYFDVYIYDATATATKGTLKFFADGIDKNTDAYVWSALEGKWVACSSQGASSTGGYVFVNVTAATTPSFSDLTGTPFVLVEAPAAAPTTFTLTAPEAGATGMPTTNVPFTWASVTDATSYKLVLSANADLSEPIAVKTAAGTAYTFTGTLENSTPYYWQVTAYEADSIEGKSDVSTFLTASGVEETGTTVEVTVPAPEVTVQAPPAPEVTVEVPTTAPATPAYIWVIIIVGALLVIAVIVLIVRTRRVP